MRYRDLFLLVCLIPVITSAEGLPGSLELDYALLRGDLEFGAVSRRLERRVDGHYAHSLWTRTTGLARLVSPTEWREQGEFTVKGKEILPLRFSDARTGDKRAYTHHVQFDRGNSRVIFDQQAPQTLPTGLLDQGSAIYALMLDPLTHGERVLPLTDGKDIDTYRFIYQGKVTAATVFGEREVMVIRRVSQRRFEREQQCRVLSLKEPDCTQPDDFTLWLLPEKHYVPVKLERRRKDEATSMVLRAARGL